MTYRAIIGIALAGVTIAPSARSATYTISYHQAAATTVERDHDSPPYAAAPAIPQVQSAMPSRPLRDPIRTFIELNRNGDAVFKQNGALPYVGIGLLALATDKQTQKWFKLTDLGAPQTKFVKTFNNAGDGKLLLPAIAMLYVAGSNEEKDTSKLWAAALVNATIWTQSLKYLAGKERPYRTPDSVRYNGPSNWHNDSWPSGHTSAATASAVVLGHQYPKMKYAFYAIAACVGVARIEGRYHWPSDVYWGAGVGYYSGWQALRHKDDIVSWRF